MPPRIGRRSRLTTGVRTLMRCVRAGTRLAEAKAPRLAGCARTLGCRRSGARALPASPESMNISLINQGLGRCSWVPGSALKGRPGTTAEFFRILLGRSVPWLIAGGFALAAAVGAEAQTARPVEHFNYVLGTQTFGPSYHFTAASPVVETAGAIAALGSNTIKFQLKPTADGDQTLAEIARSDLSSKP